MKYLTLLVLSLTSTPKSVVEGNSPGICNSIRVEEECTTAGCVVCPGGNSFCRVDETSCPGDNGGGSGGGIDSDGDGDGSGGNGNGGANNGAQNRVCFSAQSPEECSASGCTLCVGTSLCRPSDKECPDAVGTGVGSGNILCNRIRSEGECADAGCFYCADKNLCRVAEESCPGRGAQNPCRRLADATECSAVANCLWCPEAEICTGARGGRCPGSSGGGGPCRDFFEEVSCTSGSAECRWCPDDNVCRFAKSPCGDGGAGVIGNPCSDATGSDSCGGITGCVWCEDNSKCKKEEGRCQDDDNDEDGDGIVGNHCRVLTAEVDCGGNENCKWCAEQGKCKKTDDDCDAASEEVEIEVDYENGGVQLFNGGLGYADDDKVQVKLKYIFEVSSEDATRLGPSFVDLETQSFDVRQEEGTFFEGVNARRINIDMPVDGVGNIALQAFFFMEDGTITSPTGEEYDVSVGDVKFNIQIPSWNFCDTTSNPCGDGTVSSQYIDVAVEVLGSIDIPEQDDVDGSFVLGENIPLKLKLTNQILVDGEVGVMPDGFPRVENSDDGSVFIFRFPRFENSIVYDPVINSGELARQDGTGSGSGALEARSTSFVLLPCLMALYGLFIV